MRRRRTSAAPSGPDRHRHESTADARICAAPGRRSTGPRRRTLSRGPRPARVGALSAVPGSAVRRAVARPLARAPLRPSRGRIRALPARQRRAAESARRARRPAARRARPARPRDLLPALAAASAHDPADGVRVRDRALHARDRARGRAEALGMADARATRHPLHPARADGIHRRAARRAQAGRVVALLVRRVGAAGRRSAQIARRAAAPLPAALPAAEDVQVSERAASDRLPAGADGRRRSERRGDRHAARGHRRVRGVRRALRAAADPNDAAHERNENAANERMRGERAMHPAASRHQE